jgi:hypothetical protein
MGFLAEIPAAEKDVFLQRAETTNAFMPESLLDRWLRTICGLTRYALEEYQNGLDGRHLLQQVLDLGIGDLPTVAAIVRGLDDEFRRVTTRVARPVWGQEVALEYPDRLFFFYHLPKFPSKEFRETLRNLGWEEEADLLGDAE